MENNWKLHHIGVVVRDMHTAVEYYHSLEMATFDPAEYYQSIGITASEPDLLFQSSNFTEFAVNGKTPDTPVKLRIRFVPMGSATLELIQPVEGESPHSNFLNSVGEGLHHMAYLVDDLEEETGKLIKNGAKIIFSGKRPGRSFAYFDTRKVGNIITELMQWATE